MALDNHGLTLVHSVDCPECLRLPLIVGASGRHLRHQIRRRRQGDSRARADGAATPEGELWRRCHAPASSTFASRLHGLRSLGAFLAARHACCRRRRRRHPARPLAVRQVPGDERGGSRSVSGRCMQRAVRQVWAACGGRGRGKARPPTEREGARDGARDARRSPTGREGGSGDGGA